ncbi:hypothetical protein [Peribacillus frigoritolerans]|uniref:Uncharacterized protein n=1 Tax=Peribacillus castrilensis TaxID=2897690 RepID=A0AAW9N928_9BACI|nr:hypothetical protein [Peribacillus castrilensis]
MNHQFLTFHNPVSALCIYDRMPEHGSSLYVLFDLITASCRYIHKYPVKVNIVKNPLEYKRFGYKQE